MTEEKTEDKRRIEVNWVQSMAGALAAVTSAVLLSTVGVAGTLIGAALGSLAVTIGNAVYSYYIGMTKDRVSQVSTVAVSRLGVAHARVRAASQDVAEGDPRAEEQLQRADADLERARALVDSQNQPPEPPGWRQVLAGLPWKHIVVGAAALFAAAMIIIVSFELITGRSVSSYTGGSDSHQRTSIPGLGGGGAGSTDSPQPADQSTPSSAPSDNTGTTTAPDSSTTPSPSPTTGDSASPTPSEAQSSNPTPSSGTTPSYTPPASTPSGFGTPTQ